MRKATPVVLLFVLCGQAIADKAISAAGVTVRVKGQSGKMTMTLPGDNGTTTDIEVQMAALRQLDASGNMLGGGGNEKHSFESFATQSFSFSEPLAATYKGLNVTTVTFESTLVGSSRLKVETMIFQEAGGFSVGADVLNVTAGTIKFNVELGNWSWCGSDAACKGASGTGATVELDISVGPQGGGSLASKGDSKAFDLGGGSELIMLNTYSTDGGSSWLTMPEGYPRNNGSTFTLHFPRWAGTLLYDPLVSAGGSGGGAGDGSTSAAAAAVDRRVPALLAALAWAAL